MRRDLRLLRQFILEYADMTQSIIKTDNDNDVVIRKLIKYKKNSTRFHKDQNVEAEVDPESFNLVVNDSEVWEPDIDGLF